MVTVSVLMPAYNAAATIETSISSVIEQTYTDWELLVINDHSDDATAHIVGKLTKHDGRIQLLDNSGARGAAGARNTGLAVAKGHYIAFLDADDLWLPEKITRQLAMMTQTGAALSYTGFHARRGGRSDKLVQVPETVTYEQLLRGNIIGCLTAVYDTHICGKVPMPPIKRRHDFALWLRILQAHSPAHGINEPLAILRLQAGSLSANKLLAIRDTWRMYRDVIGLSVPATFYHLSRHLLQRVLR